MASADWMWLASGLGWGAVNTGELLAACPGGAGQVYQSLGSPLLDEILTQKQADRLASSRPEDFVLRIAHAETAGVQVLGYDDENYPEALRNINNPPPVLFAKGDVSLLNGQLSIGMVGARRPSAYGVEAVKALGRGIALGGAIIVSGLAAGLDAEAHKAALAVNGPTVACIAFGHDHCYPAANRKLMEVIERYGVVVSEYPPATSPEKPFFLQRNRIIAGLSHGLVVVEARKHSGTMSTVNFASDYGRDVFAVPGSIFSELSGGTNTMIGEGAYLASNASDVLSVFGIELSGEDPVEAASKQAAEGRPAPAGAMPPWQRNLNRINERNREERAALVREELPGQQSLGEMLRSQLGSTDGPVSAEQALDAFRTMQKTMPLDAGGLDERAAAVSDSVELSSRAKPAAKPAGGARPAAPKAAEGGVSPFPWHKVEHLEKDKVEDLSPAKESTAPRRAKKPSLAARLLGTAEKEPAVEQAPKAAPKAPAASPAKPPIPEPSPAPTPEPAAPGGEAEFFDFEPEQAPRVAPQTAAPPAEEPPAPSAPAPARAPILSGAPRGGKNLSGKLRTLQGAEEPKPAKREEPPKGNVDRLERSGRPPRTPAAEPVAPRLSVPQVPPAKLQAGLQSYDSTMRTAARGADASGQLSEVAQRAFEQLGPKPVALADICQRSGLSSAEAMAALTELELAGLSRQLPGRQFVISNV